MFSAVLPRSADRDLFYEGAGRKEPDLTGDKVLSVRLASGTSSWRRARKRPFIQEASRLQSEFGGAFDKYMEERENSASFSSKAGRVRAYMRGQHDCAKELRTGEASHQFQADNSLSTLTAAVKDESEAAGCDISAQFHWPLALKRSSKVRDLVPVISMRTAMALPPVHGESRCHWREYRNIGAPERSLRDRTPRTDPDCTRAPLRRLRSPPSESLPDSPKSREAIFNEKHLWTPFWGTPSMGLAHSGSSTARLAITGSKDEHDDAEQDDSIFVPASRLFDPLEASEGFSWTCAPGVDPIAITPRV